MIYLLFFIISFILIYILYDLFVIRKKKALKKMKNSKDMLLLCRVGKIDIDKVDIKKVTRYLCLTNSFIVSFVCTLALLLNNVIKNFYIWILSSSLLAILSLIPMILLLYKLIGKKIMKEGR